MTIIGAGKKCPPFLSRPLSFAKKTARLLRIAVLKAAPVRVRIILSGCVQDQRDHLDRLADSLDGMALAVTAVVYIAGLYINDRAVVVVLAAAGKDVIGLSVALVRVEADLASGIHRRMPEYTSLISISSGPFKRLLTVISPTPLKGDGFRMLILSSLLLIIITLL